MKTYSEEQFNYKVNEVISIMKNKIGELSFKTWLGYGASKISLEDDKLIWPIENEFTMNIVKERYGWQLLKTIKTIFFNSIKVELLVIEVETRVEKDDINMKDLLTRVEKVPFTENI